MSSARMSALDASFLAVETPSAHMHVGWVAEFSATAEGPLPSFPQVRRHIERRVGRAPRYRQKLAPVPLGVHAPEWIDDQAFAIDRHVYWAPGPLHDLVDQVMSMPLRRDRPLWEMWVCRHPQARTFAIVGKAHHCMVDGIAAVELGSMLLDPTREPGACEPEDWQPAPAPSAERLLVRGVRDLLGEQLGLLRWPLRAASSPVGAARGTAAGALRVTRALSHSLRAAPVSVLNGPLSPLRRLAWTERPLADLREVKRTHGTSVNDVVLAAVAGGMRAYLLRRGEQAVALKALVPVNVRSGEDESLGNHVSFMFAELPCDEPGALERLEHVHATTSARKRNREPEGADLAIKAAEHTPGVVQHAISRALASPRTFNLVVSNIPGPSEPMYLLGCPLQATYPIVPLADRHAVSIGMTTIGERACFGVYADREALPDAGALAADIDDALTELLALTPRG
ncbi:MAG: Diacylglycerol O-acyltransferase [Solirubrobacterales bacterium]|nr:Diacylglycerol O-acyltransferase [Solirubrobacterales bacterium]